MSKVSATPAAEKRSEPIAVASRLRPEPDWNLVIATSFNQDLRILAALCRFVEDYAGSVLNDHHGVGSCGCHVCLKEHDLINSMRWIAKHARKKAGKLATRVENEYSGTDIKLNSKTWADDLRKLAEMIAENNKLTDAEKPDPDAVVE